MNHVRIELGEWAVCRFCSQANPMWNDLRASSWTMNPAVLSPTYACQQFIVGGLSLNILRIFFKLYNNGLSYRPPRYPFLFLTCSSKNFYLQGTASYISVFCGHLELFSSLLIATLTTTNALKEVIVESSELLNISWWDNSHLCKEKENVQDTAFFLFRLLYSSCLWSLERLFHLNISQSVPGWTQRHSGYQDPFLLNNRSVPCCLHWGWLWEPLRCRLRHLLI